MVSKVRGLVFDVPCLPPLSRISLVLQLVLRTRSPLAHYYVGGPYPVSGGSVILVWDVVVGLYRVASVETFLSVGQPVWSWWLMAPRCRGGRGGWTGNAMGSASSSVRPEGASAASATVSRRRAPFTERRCCRGASGVWIWLGWSLFWSRQAFRTRTTTVATVVWILSRIVWAVCASRCYRGQNFHISRGRPGFTGKTEPRAYGLSLERGGSTEYTGSIPNREWLPQGTGIWNSTHFQIISRSVPLTVVFRV